MARIRTIKPEAFSSESLAAVSIAAERTFYGLLTQADDHGRFRDQAAVIAGLLWSLRPEHGPIEVEDDLNQLAMADLICRYEGEDGKRYLHIVTFAKHQKVNRPSGVRHPVCPHHDAGRTPLPSPLAHGGLREESLQAHRALSEGSTERRESTPSQVSAGQSEFSEPSMRVQGGLPGPSVRPHGPDLGPRIMDLGSTPLGGASAPAPETVSAQQMVAEYAAACPNRPPSAVLGQLGRSVAKLLADGIAAAHIRAGLMRLREKALHPSVLPSLVNEAMNPPQTQAPARPAHRTYANPADAEAAYGGAL
ncbi:MULTISPECIES: hypothetical protein [unclassified Streptomyces]|uniref:hypothetical protein n=1 Tax=unclassified Streptomyces TaxID=2593676 RepID=UPI002251C15B|nr:MULTISPECIES: hypothetical protein [unclassified Streptomyces]MCX5123544.1 hypothetical protein [Streptomyces sp. NBC_00347]MCX5405637.1 hypothetical protein [Streptomyces sp. NBC_00086]